MAQQRQQQPAAIEGFQEGSRWINARPSGEVVADWFEKNVKLHDGLEAKHYVTGVVLIGGGEKIKEARVANNGQVVFVEVERYAWTPYAKVETRIAYFWDHMANHNEWVGIIEPVEMPRRSDAGVYNENLPPGFYRLPMQEKDGKFTHYVGCSMRVRILMADTVEWGEDVDEHHWEYPAEGGGTTVHDVVETRKVLRGIPVAEYPPATKQIATIGRFGADPFSLMKAETGAVGRALGMAGMLVIPGSGVATAEDMQEIATARGEPVQVEAALPDEDREVDVRDEIQSKIARLQTEHADGYDELVAWAAEKKIDLERPKETQLRGLLLQVDRKLGS